MPFSCQPLNDDIFFFDREGLQTTADKGCISLGRRDNITEELMRSIARNAVDFIEI